MTSADKPIKTIPTTIYNISLKLNFPFSTLIFLSNVASKTVEYKNIPAKQSNKIPSVLVIRLTKLSPK